MNVSHITMQQIVYWPSSVSISGSELVSCWVSSSSSKNSAQGRAVCEYIYPAGKLTISEGWTPEVLPVGVGGAGGVRGGSGVGSGVRTLHWAGGGAPIPLRLQRVCRFFAVKFGKEGSRMFGFDEALPGVFVSQPLPCYALETQHPASSLLGPRCVVS